jgi:NAD(P)-dependent dehydrogenase (short-subunit alcohol dehydrogenase family)
MEASRSNQQQADFPEGVAIVVGGSGGIGSVICQTLAAYGSDIALTYFSNQGKAQAVANAVGALGRRALARQVKPLDKLSVEAFVGEVATQFGKIHTVVYAAGPHVYMKFISRVEPELFQQYLNIDAMSFLHLAQATLPHLRKSSGSIVAVHTAGLKRWPKRDVLSVGPKAAVEALVQGIAREEGRFGIRANSIGVGFIHSGMYHKLVADGEYDDSYQEAAKASRALNRDGSAQDVAQAVAFLASSRANYITGQCLNVDGGFSV